MDTFLDSLKKFLLFYLGVVSVLLLLWTVNQNSQSGSVAGVTANAYPTPVSCKAGLNSFSVGNACKLGVGAVGFRRAVFSCYDGTKGEYNTASCLNSSQLNAAAKDACHRLSKCANVTPKPSVSPWPSIVISKPVPMTPTPAPYNSCNPILLSSFREPCGDGLYRYIDFVCKDQYQGTMGSPTSCKDQNTWLRYAQEECNRRPVCQATPTPRIQF